MPSTVSGSETQLELRERRGKGKGERRAFLHLPSASCVLVTIVEQQ